jgi:hypothetical protein
MIFIAKYNDKKDSESILNDLSSIINANDKK